MPERFTRSAKVACKVILDLYAQLGFGEERIKLSDVLTLSLI